MSVNLAIVPQTPESPAARARRLLAEAKSAAMEQIEILERALAQVQGLSAEIADGGEAYPAGVRDVCRKLAEDVAIRAQTLDTLVQRGRLTA